MILAYHSGNYYIIQVFSYSCVMWLLSDSKKNEVKTMVRSRKRMKTALLGFGLAFGIVVFCIGEMHAAPSLDELIPPATEAKAPTEVAKPEDVTVTNVKNSSAGSAPRVQAASMQDAVNKARTLTSVVSEIKAGSGIGYVSIGKATYKSYKNRNATLISQRGAYMDALMKAKAELAKYLYGMTVSAQEELNNSLATVDTDEETKAVMKNYRIESIKENVEAMLRGYVVFSVEEEPSTRTVTVTIATTPRTRAAGLSLSSVAIASTDFRSALNKLYAELSTGTLPPEGARVFVIPDAQGQKQFFCVGFGSAIVRRHQNASIAPQLAEQAKRASSMRAARNLVALLHGDKIVWESGHTDITKEQFQDAGVKELLKKSGDDSLAKVMGVTSQEEQDSFMNVLKTTDAYKSSTEGKLPPGVQERTWTDDDGDWAYTLLIYNPNMTASVIQNRDSRENLQKQPQNATVPAPAQAAPNGIKPLQKVTTDADDL